MTLAKETKECSTLLDNHDIQTSNNQMPGSARLVRRTPNSSSGTSTRQSTGDTSRQVTREGQMERVSSANAYETDRRRRSVDKKKEKKNKMDITALEQVKWMTLVLGNHYPEELDGGRWTSPQNDDYPIDIVLGLNKVCNVYKVLLDVDEHFIPSRVDIAVGLGDCHSPVTYKNARDADFKRPVLMEYFKRERSQSRMETKTAYTDTIGQYVWLKVYEPLEHKKNPTRQVAITNIDVLGYVLSDEEINQLQPREEFESQVDSARSFPAPVETVFVKPKKEVTRHSYNGDGMETTSDLLASDPLTTIRTVKRTLEEKKRLAKQAGHEVEATVCLRAVQRLVEYEGMVEDLHARRSNALIHNDLSMAERHRLAMIDCRDTALRAIHVDLLFNRAELRSIGVASEWSDQA